MGLRKAQRKQAKLKIGIASPSGGGKTYSSLLLAKGLVGDWDKVAVIDTENGSADLYDHLGDLTVGAMLMSSASYTGEVKLERNDKFLLATAPPPYISAFVSRSAQDQLDVKFMPPLEQGEIGLDDAARFAPGYRDIVHSCRCRRLRGQEQVAVMGIPSLERCTAAGVHAEIAGEVLADPFAAERTVLEFLDTDEIGPESVQHLADPLRLEFTVRADAGVYVPGHEAQGPAVGGICVRADRHYPFNRWNPETCGAIHAAG